MEIKFRGKQVDSGKWYHGFYVRGRHDEHYILSKYNGLATIAHSVEGDTLGVHLSCFDSFSKSGKEIFSGDIVRASYLIEHKEAYPVPRRVEKFEDVVCLVVHDELQFILKNPESPWSKELRHAHGIEVIGNIHDNPELLETAD